MQISNLSKNKNKIQANSVISSMSFDINKSGKIDVFSHDIIYNIENKKNSEIIVVYDEQEFNIEKPREKMSIIMAPGLRGETGLPGRDGQDADGVGIQFQSPVDYMVATMTDVGPSYADGMAINDGDLMLVEDEKKIYKRNGYSWQLHLELDEYDGVSIRRGELFGGKIFMVKDNAMSLIKDTELTTWNRV